MSDELTVELLAELREMFPDTWLSVEVSWKPIIGHYYFIRVYGTPRQTEAKATLEEVMAQIRQWHKCLSPARAKEAQQGRNERNALSWNKRRAMNNQERRSKNEQQVGTVRTYAL